MSTAVIADAFAEHREHLWCVCYRMTGSTADADDLVQDTFERLATRPPARMDEPLRPWLMTVAMNLSRDLLRARKRRQYTGPWLPALVELERATAHLEISGEARYERAESATYAFLRALEALTPKQRGVLVLRDVLGYSTQEVSDALEMSTASVKTTLHRARKEMASYDAARCRPSEALSEATVTALMRFMEALQKRDVATLEELLREDVVALNDGGGVYAAAQVPLVGRERVIRFYQRLNGIHMGKVSANIIELNGVPVLWVEVETDKAQFAPRSVTRIELDASGRIAEIHSVLAPRKLHALTR